MEVASPPDVELSDKSFGLSDSPEKKQTTKRAASRTRSSSASAGAASVAARGRKPGDGVPRFPTLKPKLIGRAASLGRIGRPPRDASPALPMVPPAPASALQQHGVTPEDGHELRIRALEAQGGATHKFMVDLAVAMRGMVQNIEHHRTSQKLAAHELEETQRVMFSIQKDLEDSKAILEGKLLQIDKSLGDPRGNELAIASRMLIMEDYMKKSQGFTEFVAQKVSAMDDDKGADGAFISGHLSQQAAEIKNVKSMVQQMEARGVPAATTSMPSDPDGAVPFTRRMLLSMGQMYESFGVMKNVSERTDTHQAHIENLGLEVMKTNGRMDVVEVTIDEMESMQPVTVACSQAYGQCQSGQCQSGACDGKQCADTGPCADPNPFVEGSTAPPPAPGLQWRRRRGGAGSSGDGNPHGAVMAAVIGGNGICHCVHVTDINTRLVAIESWKRAHDVIHERGHDPLLKSGWQPAGSSPSGAPGGDPAGGAAAPTPAAGIGPSSTPTSLPLDLKGPLMAIAWKDRPLLDEKMALHDDFRFNGVKGGPEWKDNVEKAIISKAPVMRIILNWVEEMDTEPISEALFLRAVGTRLTEEQVQIINASIWGGSSPRPSLARRRRSSTALRSSTASTHGGESSSSSAPGRPSGWITSGERSSSCT